MGGLRNATVCCGCIYLASVNSGALGPFTPVDPSVGTKAVREGRQFSTMANHDESCSCTLHGSGVAQTLQVSSLAL